MEFAQLTDIGRARRHNEDYLGYVQPATAAQAQSHGWLFAIADGVGGQELGEVAARTAVESMLANFRNSAGAESHSSLLRRLVQAANHEVYDAGRSARPGGAAMSSTVVACALRHDRAVVAHVGDSRCYLIRQGVVTALTRDHTVVAEQLRLRLISPREAAESEKRHVLNRSVGSDLFVNVDTTKRDVLPGDVLLLCSDGLHNSVGQADLAQALVPNGNQNAGDTNAADLNAAARGLVALANQRDGGDNISVQIIRIRGVERMGMYRRQLQRFR